jgi:predicted patatin/cPLA2 family phospholipase
MTDFSRNALVVEGGGMRGAFTSGVLDAFYNSSSTLLIYMWAYLLVRPM